MARGKSPAIKASTTARRATSPAALAYSEAQKNIIRHREGHLQVVACAGSGKTETVAARVAALIREGAAPASIIAFTFTHAAADALKARILKKVALESPGLSLDRLSPMFIGTIHSFCLRFLQERVPRYAAFDLFEDHRIVGLLNREYRASPSCCALCGPRAASSCRHSTAKGCPTNAPAGLASSSSPMRR